jgi:purine nucleoside permease
MYERLEANAQLHVLQTPEGSKMKVVNFIRLLYLRAAKDKGRPTEGLDATSLRTEEEVLAPSF